MIDPTDAQAIEAGLDNLCEECGQRHGEGECPMFVEVEDAPYNDRERILAAQADAEYQRANEAEAENERLRAGIQEVLDSGSIQHLRERAEQAESALAHVWNLLSSERCRAILKATKEQSIRTTLCALGAASKETK